MADKIAPTVTAYVEEIMAEGLYDTPSDRRKLLRELRALKAVARIVMERDRELERLKVHLSSGCLAARLRPLVRRLSPVRGNKR
ncbi:MAG TPA: hypothetical protein VMT56_00420 [Candidatus Bathyarchaeia archaeon]|nr:hypothetical protein [Candidatus Bathyarchaeia archaeon]